MIGQPVLLIFVTVLHAVFSQGPQKDLNKAAFKCMDGFPTITTEMLEDIKQTKRFPSDADENLKCFMLCVGKELELVNPDGSYHHEGLKDLTMYITDDVAHDDAHEIVSKCITVDDPDECVRAYQYAACKLDELKSYTFTKDFCSTC